MYRALTGFYARGINDCFLAIMSVGEAKNLFGDFIKQRLEAWINTMTIVLIDAGVTLQKARKRLQNAVIEIQGALVLVKILD